MLRYQIRVRGHLSRDWWDKFNGLTVAPMPDGETLLFGGVPDQSALFGMLSRIQGVGLPLISMHCVRVKQKAENRRQKAE